MKINEKTSTERNRTRGINRIGEESLPVLVERMCEHRGEPTPHIKRDDGTYACLSSELCTKNCESRRSVY